METKRLQVKNVELTGVNKMEYKRLGEYDLKSLIGQQICVVFIAKSTVIKPQKANGDFMVIVMKDRDTEVDAKIFSVSDEDKEKVIPGEVYAATIDVKVYDKAKEGYSCIISKIDKNETPKEYFADWAENVNDCAIMISEQLSIIKDTTYGKIITPILQRLWTNFSKWPAGRGIHHTRLGELLCHTATTTAQCINTARGYQKVYGEAFINMPLLIAGSLAHDIGKVEEYDVDDTGTSVEYSTSSALQTHIINGILEIEREAIRQEVDTNCEEIKLLRHMISSHHGQLEWGSPINPAIPEAAILNSADMIDSEMWRYNKAFKETNKSEATTIWVGGKAKSIFKDNTK